MMNVDELEQKIKEEKDALVKLEVLYEAEADEGKSQKLEYKISRKEEGIDKLEERQQVLLDREAKEDTKDKNAEEEDTDVCPECGGNLVYVGKDNEGITDVFECEQCKELFLDE